MHKLLSVSFLFFVPSLAFAHGGPEMFIFLWSIMLLPTVLATMIAPKGCRLAWLIGGIVITVVSVLVISFYITIDSLAILFVLPVLLIPGALFHRIKSSSKQQKLENN